MDKAGKKYWDNNWDGSELPEPIRPFDSSLNNYVNFRFHEYFETRLADKLKRQQPVKLLEIGSAKSAWLPYFNQVHGCQVAGLDYSEYGCELSRKILDREEVLAQVYCMDMFKPDEDLLNTFDIVISFGVAEHFENTDECLAAMSGFLKADGLLVTNIPNIVGIIGFLQKFIDKKIYDVHVPISLGDIKAVHEKAGLEIESAEYFLPINLGVLNFDDKKDRWFYPLATRLSSWLSKLVWVFDRNIKRLPASAIFSPYIMTVASKKKKN